LDLAEIVYSHHERWDGTGHPRHLKGTEIPLISRIISIAETYERILTKEGIPTEESKRKAIEYIKEGAGKQFDPLIAEFFVQMMEVEEP
jgi:response regulator RpfG family c-di-GMP phosphodiesterase